MKFSGILICCDVDGTLALHGVVPEEHSKAIRYFQQNGGLFTLATGRHPAYTKTLYDAARPNTYLIAENGTLIYDIEKEKAVYEWFMQETTKECVASILEQFPEHDFVKIHVPGGYYDIFEKPYQWQSEFEKINMPIYKVVFKQPYRISNEMVNAFLSNDQFSVTQSCSCLVEIYRKGAGKGTAVQKLRKLLGDQIHTVICIGDYYNDISMLQEADIAVAVKDGDERIYRYADWIAPEYEKFPVSWLISEIERKAL